MYDLFKERLEEVRRTRQQAQEQVNRKKEEVTPLQMAVNNARRTIETMQGDISNLVSNCIFKSHF